MIADAAGTGTDRPGRRIGALPDALGSLDQIDSVVACRTPVVFIDLDGALSCAGTDPTAATLAPGVAGTVRALSAVCPVAVISGRTLSEIRATVGIPGLWYAGSHGLAVLDPDGLLHRNGINRGVKVVDLSPDVNWGRGDAVRCIVGQLTTDRRLLPIYIGADLADEDAFDAVRHDGIGIVVRSRDGDRATGADFTLNGTDGTTRLLTRLVKALSPARSVTEGWSLSFEGYHPQAERLREALCAVGNGALASRAAAPDGGDSAAHYPGTYVAGVYNRLTDVVDGVPVSNESIVNLPDWLPLTFRIDGGRWFDVDTAELLSYRQTIDIRTAECVRELRFQDPSGRRTSVTQRRFVSMHDPYVCALQMTLVAENWSGSIDIRSTIDSTITNSGVARYRALSGRHLEATSISELPGDAVLVEARTTQSHIPIAVAARTTVYQLDGAAEVTARFTTTRPARGTTSPPTSPSADR